MALALLGCKGETEHHSATAAAIENAIRLSQAEIDDHLAVMPRWYRAGVKASYRISVDSEAKGVISWHYVETESAKPMVEPVPLRRISCMAIVLLPLLVCTSFRVFHCDGWRRSFYKSAGVNKNDRTEFVICGLLLTLGISVAAIAAVLVLWVPVTYVFKLMAYGLTGSWYYVPWHFLLFVEMSLLLSTLTVTSVNPLLELLKSGVPIKRTLGVTGMILEIFAIIFTVRDMVLLASGHPWGG